MDTRRSLSDRLTQRASRAILLIGVAVALVIGALAYGGSPLVRRLDHAVLDGLMLATASGKTSRHTVVVDIDEVSLSAVGQWPWPRYRVAALLQRIAEQQPAAIGLDILFSEPDRSSLVNIRQTFRNDFGVELTFAGVPEGLTDNDGFLGYQIARTGTIASSYFYFDHVNTAPVQTRTGVVFDGRTDLLSLNQATGVLVNAPEIASQSRFGSFFNTQIDEDGLLRRFPLLIEHQGVVHPHLSLAAAMRSLGVVSGTVETGLNGLSLRIGSHRIPIDARGFSTLRFAGKPRLYDAIPAVEVLNGRFDPAALKGKIVLIGSSATGLNDIYPTAMDARFPGLKAQAAMVENILDDDVLRTPAWAPLAIFAACAVVGLLMSALFIVVAHVHSAVLGTAIALLAMACTSTALWTQADLFVSPAAPMLVAVVLFVSFFVVRFAIERQRAQARLRALENARQVTIESMASVAETRDPETGGHIKRTQHYVKAVAEELARRGHHAQLLTPDYINLLFLSAPLHDIGKVGVPDHILLKPGKLTPDELVIMKRHAEYGADIIRASSQHIEGDNFLVVAGEIAATHHERWDGTGYPKGLAGDAIPVAGRIMAIADIYDALISRRCYKEPFTHAHATQYLREQRGTIFDPLILDVFFAIEDTIQDIAARYKDEAEGEVRRPHETAPVLVPAITAAA